MFRHTYNAILVVLFLCGTVHAQWSTNAWPAWEHPRESYQRALDVRAALVERYDVCGAGHEPVHYPMDITYRGVYGPYGLYLYAYTNNLDKMKWCISEATNTPYKANDLLFTLAGYITRSPNWCAPWTGHPYALDSSSNVVLITSVTQLLANCQLPLNYFYELWASGWNYTVYTYARDMAGLGEYGSPTNNYDGVGHPHGTTNSITIAGGTNFPVGRTEWYTTDYGWDGMTNIISKLVWEYRPAVLPGLTCLSFSGGSWYANVTQADRLGNWPDAKALAETRYVYQSGETPDNMNVYTMGGKVRRSFYSANILNQSSAISNTWDFPTQYNHQVSYFAKAHSPYLVWDSHDTGLIAGTNVMIAESDIENAKRYVSPNIGSSDIPTWCDEPPDPGSSSRGRALTRTNVFSIIKWDVPGGFKYR